MWLYSALLLPDTTSSCCIVIIIFLIPKQRMIRIFKMTTGDSGRSVTKQAIQVIHTENLALVKNYLCLIIMYCITDYHCLTSGSSPDPFSDFNVACNTARGPVMRHHDEMDGTLPHAYRKRTYTFQMMRGLSSNTINTIYTCKTGPSRK